MTTFSAGPKLVAHRGYSSQYPENTLLAIEKALIAGACFVEFDVHLTRDGVPVVVHDNNIERTTGINQNINAMLASEVRQTPAYYAEKFQKQFIGETIPLLADVIKLLDNWSERSMFLEIKRGSLQAFGVEFVTENIMKVVEPWVERIIVISFDDQVLKMLSENFAVRTGWVFDRWESTTLETAKAINPDFVFADVECIPNTLKYLPKHDWKWVVYEIDDARQAADWIERGADMVETNAIGQLMSAPFFKDSQCNE